MELLVIQALNGLASAASLFLVAVGLSIIFGVTRVVNFAHGAFYMLGAYLAYTLTAVLAGAVGFWAGLVLAALAVTVLGVGVEVLLLRRIYGAPELFQLLATFGVTLLVEDLVVLIWGPADLLGPRAPGLTGAVRILGQAFPQYDLFLIVLSPLLLALLWLLFQRTRWGVLVRAATQDRTMVAALGVNQTRLFTSVFALGVFLAALGGALQLPRETVYHSLDIQVIVEAFVIVVIGGLGSISGAFVAAVLVSELNAFGILVLPRISLVLVFLVMAVVLIVRPWGLLGKPQAPARSQPGTPPAPIAPLSPGGRIGAAVLLVGLVLLPQAAGSYGLSVAAEVLIFALFAASLHFLMGTGGMISFGHAAYFGLGAYGAALLVVHLHLTMLPALVLGPLLGAGAAVLFGGFCVRLSGVYLAMLTLACAQIAWSIVFQWDAVTGGDNGLLGVWPAAWAASPAAFYYLCLAVCGGGVVALRLLIFSPFGYALRACRDSPLRAAALGLDRHRIQWLGFAVAGSFAAVAGALFAFLKGSVFPDSLAVPVSVDGLVMVLLGGLDTISGPLIGALVYKLLAIIVTSYTAWWKLVLGSLIILLVVAFPQGIAGYAGQLWQRLAGREAAS